jgi:uncharacterized membrane protein YkoI
MHEAAAGGQGAVRRDGRSMKGRTIAWILAAAAAVGAELLAAGEAAAADPQRCLTPQQRREAIAAKKAVPLGRAVRAVRKKMGGEVVGARLCEGENGLVYMLTVLSGSGKVTRAMVDAADGRFMNGR